MKWSSVEIKIIYLDKDNIFTASSDIIDGEDNGIGYPDEWEG